MIVDESLLAARSRSIGGAPQGGPFESRGPALGRDRRRGFAARIGEIQAERPTAAGGPDYLVRMASERGPRCWW